MEKLMTSNFKWLALGIAASALAVGCASTQPTATVAQTIAKRSELSTLNELIGKAGLEQTLSGAGPFTVFAPTNDAFKTVPAKTMQELGNDPERLKALLLHHVVPAKAMAKEVKPGNVKTANGTDLPLSRAGEFVTADDAMVQSADIMALNGVIHTVDRVIIPPVRR
jgi:uncharacterized surface protein with fasciclin (FAS1) repeats